MSENQINQLMKSREFSFLNKIWNLTFRLTSENIDTIGSRNLAHSNFLFIIKSSDGIICGGYYDLSLLNDASKFKNNLLFNFQNNDEPKIKENDITKQKNVIHNTATVPRVISIRRAPFKQQLKSSQISLLEKYFFQHLYNKIINVSWQIENKTVQLPKETKNQISLHLSSVNEAKSENVTKVVTAAAALVPSSHPCLQSISLPLWNILQDCTEFNNDLLFKIEQIEFFSVETIKETQISLNLKCESSHLNMVKNFETASKPKAINKGKHSSNLLGILIKKFLNYFFIFWVLVKSLSTIKNIQNDSIACLMDSCSDPLLRPIFKNMWKFKKFFKRKL
jgi:hypothetical protein